MSYCYLFLVHEIGIFIVIWRIADCHYVLINHSFWSVLFFVLLMVIRHRHYSHKGQIHLFFFHKEDIFHYNLPPTYACRISENVYLSLLEQLSCSFRFHLFFSHFFSTLTMFVMIIYICRIDASKIRILEPFAYIFYWDILIFYILMKSVSGIW